MEKTKITGYFYVHSGSLSVEHAIQYANLLEEHTALAVELPGGRRHDLNLLRAISDGRKPPEVYDREYLEDLDQNQSRIIWNR